MMSQFSNNPIAYAGQGIPDRPFINNDICFISKLEDPSSFSFHLPSPYMHYEDEAVLFQHLHNLELQQQSFIVENTVTNTLNNMADSSKKNAANDPKEGCSKECNSTAEQIPRKKFSKKDRHSKINTARGPRDRRMRLSLDVARKFFDLQDMLGFDKASKTVEWLLTKSQSAILELLIGLPQMRRSCVLGANCASSTSECEVISGVDESATNENQQGRAKVKPSCTKEKKKVKAARRIPFHPQAKHSRDQARERARERTKEKIRRLSEAKLHFGAINRELDRLGSWSSLETGEESGTQDYIKNPPYEMLREVEELSCHERQLARTGENLVNDSMLVGGNCGPSSASFNFQLSAGICNEPQFADLQFYCKSPEAYSNINLSG